ncbi:hypothetical protein HYG86_09295 [Alkalicella caledoniensis]|uniref:Uncharacterized protein n=1 Tax=Alkalicella caledoniensis TaxID=2731377 RepID=A0A7G9W8E4_ALKCA|nr:hypothetical protein [Alkalicella caledoniensis]QNO14956.1 hypothetical protein HYG86_09295 [Alkalicella caledoniensis]
MSELKDVAGVGILSKKRKYADPKLEAERLRIRSNFIFMVCSLSASLISVIVSIVVLILRLQGKNL